MDWLIIFFGVILVVAGLLGAVMPGLPGPPLSFLALVALQFTEEPPFSENFLLIMGLVMASVTLLDYFIPIYGTKKFGGSKAGVRGSTIGLIISVFILPVLGITIGPFGLLGIILGPFIGAYLGELLSGQSKDTAMRSAFGSFIGFMAGTLMKLAYSFIVGVYFVMGLF
jgi:hypothetical protein